MCCLSPERLDPYRGPKWPFALNQSEYGQGQPQPAALDKTNNLIFKRVGIILSNNIINHEKIWRAFVELALKKQAIVMNFWVWISVDIQRDMILVEKNRQIMLKKKVYILVQ